MATPQYRQVTPFLVFTSLVYLSGALLYGMYVSLLTHALKILLFIMGVEIEIPVHLALCKPFHLFFANLACTMLPRRNMRCPRLLRLP